MVRAISFVAGAGIGAGLMYILDPQLGRRRRALARDKVVSLAHEAQDAAHVVSRDLSNRIQGLKSGDMSVLAGGKRALANPLRGAWSPTGRAMLIGAGTGLFIFGLTQHAPTACILGTIGCALAAEGFTNAGIDDIAGAADKLTERAKGMVGAASDVAANVATKVKETAHRFGDHQPV